MFPVVMCKTSFKFHYPFVGILHESPCFFIRLSTSVCLLDVCPLDACIPDAIWRVHTTPVHRTPLGVCTIDACQQDACLPNTCLQDACLQDACLLPCALPSKHRPHLSCTDRILWWYTPLPVPQGVGGDVSHTPTFPPPAFPRHFNPSG